MCDGGRERLAQSALSREGPSIMERYGCSQKAINVRHARVPLNSESVDFIAFWRPFAGCFHIYSLLRIENCVSVGTALCLDRRNVAAGRRSYKEMDSPDHIFNP